MAGRRIKEETYAMVQLDIISSSYQKNRNTAMEPTYHEQRKESLINYGLTSLFRT